MSDLLGFQDIPIDREDRQWAAAQCTGHESPRDALREFAYESRSFFLPGDLEPVALLEVEPNPQAEDPGGLDAWMECARHELRIRCVVDTERRPLEHQLFELSWWRWISGLDPVALATPSKVRIPDLSELHYLADRAAEFLGHNRYPSGVFPVVRISKGCMSTAGWGRCHVLIEIPGRDLPAHVPNYLLDVVEWRKEGEGDV